ncbi:MAG TPA: alpha/beta hydrolase-fold protein [Bryobacteraceae bacterium]|nr:alpha/beta hydrolase-fold protein [Bryobacteraceae bacterium]
MRLFIGLIVAGQACSLAYQAPAPAIVRDLTHFSQVMNATRAYQAILPPNYAASQKRYPVIYWLHGYEQPDAARDAAIAAYVAAHDVIVVNAGPVESAGQFPLYFPELADEVDKTLRTVPDRNHRAVTGFSLGGFMAFSIAGKYPDLVASASSFMGLPAAPVGPRNLDVEYRLEDLYGNYDGVRTRLVTGSHDFLQFYHRRLNSIWLYARSGHETEEFDSDHGTPEIAKTLDFHMRAFANPLPKPPMFQHADVYPDFTVWGWEVASDRKQPGFTVFENVTAKGFRSAVREWLPGGALIPRLKMSIVSAPMYAPGSSQAVTYIRLRDGAVRREAQKADAQGRLGFELDGDAWEVGISAGPAVTVSGFELADAAWATAGGPVKLRVRFLNKGQTRSGTTPIQWESPDDGVKIEPASSRLFGLAPAESGLLPVTLTVPDPSRAVVKLFAVDGANRMPIEVPLFPQAAAASDFHLADGQTISMYQHAVEQADVTLGEGNADGRAAPGEAVAVLLPDGEAMRAGELFTNDACVDTSLRASDSWTEYDRAGVSAVYTLAAIRPDCPPGHVVRALVRVLIPNAPNHRVRYAAIEFPVWYRQGEEPKK